MAVWQARLSEFRRQMVPDSRSSCTEGSVAEVGARSTDEKRSSVSDMTTEWQSRHWPSLSAHEGNGVSKIVWHKIDGSLEFNIRWVSTTASVGDGRPTTGASAAIYCQWRTTTVRTGFTENYRGCRCTDTFELLSQNTLGEIDNSRIRIQNLDGTFNLVIARSTRLKYQSLDWVFDEIARSTERFVGVAVRHGSSDARRCRLTSRRRQWMISMTGASECRLYGWKIIGKPKAYNYE